MLAAKPTHGAGYCRARASQARCAAAPRLECRLHTQVLLGRSSPKMPSAMAFAPGSTRRASAQLSWSRTAATGNAHTGPRMTATRRLSSLRIQRASRVIRRNIHKPALRRFLLPGRRSWHSIEATRRQRTPITVHPRHLAQAHPSHQKSHGSTCQVPVAPTPAFA
jgi:hypothetical protein